MESVGPRLGDGVDYAAGGPPILGRVVAGEHGEFRNRIHAQADPDHAARPAVAVIVDAVPVHPVVVLRGAAAGNGQLRAKAPVPAHRAAGEGHLRFDRVDTGGKGGERRPIAAVQGQLAHLLGLNLGTDGGRAELHQRRGSGDLHGLTYFSNF